MLQPSSIEFFDLLRKYLERGKEIPSDESDTIELFQASSLPQEFWGVAMVLYQPGQSRISVIRAKQGFDNVRQTLNQIIAHQRFGDFTIRDRARCRLQCDFIVDEPQAVDPELLSQTAVDNSDEAYHPNLFLDLEIDLRPIRFELGIDGLRVVSNDARRYLLPGDAIVRSILGVGQLRNYLARLFPDDSIEQLSFFKFRSLSYISTSDGWTRLYRGYPTIPLSNEGSSDAETTGEDEIGQLYAAPAREKLFDAAAAGVSWIVANQSDSGKFLYYYDGATDSRRDHEHPSRDPSKNPYYNLLRHCGGVLTLLFYAAVQRNMSKPIDSDITEAIELGIDWFVRQLVRYETADKQEAAYAFYNTKAKLGGSGLGLYMLSKYQQLYDDRYFVWANRVANHIANEVQDSGEFMYYHVYLNKRVFAEQNRDLFSFYYPGEAAIGLANHCEHLSATDPALAYFQQKLKLALSFLVIERPKVYRQHFTSLPADSWLMMAINDLWDNAEFHNEEYRDFVFSDADQMVQHQYDERSALYPDYVGSFYYSYGDHPYPDGARAEGLLSAYELALKVGDEKRVARYRQAIDRIAWATLRLCNTPDSVYSSPNPEKTVGGIRFKFTRQWFRVDTIQHVASFYLKLLAIPPDASESSRNGPIKQRFLS